MKISLPENYSYNDNDAYVKDGILYITQLESFRALMYDITYHIRDGTKCHFCSKKVVKKSSATLDHIIPQDIGGPTIPDNLYVTCPDCNSLKSNMTESEFLYFLTLSEEKRRIFLKDIQLYKEYLKKHYVPVLPDEWICEKPIEKILVYFYPDKGVDSRSYKRLDVFYKKYGRIWKPVIVDKNYKLLDGFYSLLYAKNNSISSVPVIVLENVILQ